MSAYVRSYKIKSRVCFIMKNCIYVIILGPMKLTHWGRVTHICVGNLTIIGSDNGLSPRRRQAITWTNVGILLTGPLQCRNKLQWNVNRNSYIFIQENPFENVVWKMAAILSWPQCVNMPGRMCWATWGDPIDAVEYKHRERVSLLAAAPIVKETNGSIQFIKLLSYKYKEYHYKDESVVTPCYFRCGNSCTGKTTVLYWIMPQMIDKTKTALCD